MLAELTSRQVTEWMAFYRIEQLGEDIEFRADFRAANNAINIARAIGGKPIEAKAWMPFHPIQQAGQSDEQLHAALSGRADLDAKRKPRTPKAAADGGDTGKPVRPHDSPRRLVPKRSKPGREGSEGVQ